MKRYVYLAALGGCMFAACSSVSKSEVSGELAGVASDTLLVRSIPISADGKPGDVKMDTVPMKNGTFAFNLGNDVLKQVYIFAKPSTVPNADGSMPAMSMRGASFILLPGKQVTINGSLEEYTLGGDAFYDKYTQVQAQMKPFMQQLDSLNKHCMTIRQNGATPEELRAAYAPASDIIKNMNQVNIDYVKGHLDEDVSVFLLSQTSMDVAEKYELLTSMGESVKNGMMKPYYDMCKQNCEKDMARLEAKKNVKEGGVAPEFVLKDIKGNDFSLASLKGKYVVLDFWGSWCGWCVKGFPEMKKTYEKYKGKIEFVGIACNDKEKAWKQAVEEHQLPWINVRNTEGADVAVKYGVSGYPTKMILDKDGKILKIVVGESPEFYTYLEGLLK